MNWKDRPGWYRPRSCRGDGPADVGAHDADDLNAENNELFLGVVKALEWIKGNPRVERAEVVQFLEQILVSYGVRADRNTSPKYRGIDAKHTRAIDTDVARERADVVIPRKKAVRTIVKLLEDGDPMTVVRIENELTEREYNWARDDHRMEVDYYLRNYRKIFRVAHWTMLPGGGKENYWTLAWM